jgi:hypothetical protein
MTKARTLANFISDNNEFADGTISVSEVSGAAPLASPSFTGNAAFDTNTLYVDASNNRVGIGLSNPGRMLTLYENDQPVFQITNDTSGAANTRGLIQYIANGTTDAVFDNQGSGSGGMFRFMQAGTERLRMTTSAFVANEGGNDYDFRVESDSNANMLFVNADTNRVGIGTGVGQSTLSVSGSPGTGNALATFSAGSDSALLAIGTSNSNGYAGTQTWSHGGGFASAITFGNVNDQGRVVSRTAAAIYTDGVTTFGRGDLVFATKGSSDSEDPTQKIRIHRGGDITFYQDDGTTSGLFFDASTSNLTLTDSGVYIDYGTLDIRRDSHVSGDKRSTFWVSGAGGYPGNNYFQLGTYGAGLAGIERIRVYGNNNGNNSDVLRINSSDSIIINENSYSTADFRVESDAYSGMLLVDASANQVTMGGTGSNDAAILTLGSPGQATYVTNATEGEFGIIRYNSTSTSNQHSGIVFRVTTNNASNNAYGSFGLIQTAYNRHDSRFYFNLRSQANNTRQYANIDSEVGWQVNDGGEAHIDFRVESDSNANMLFVDAGQDRVKIGTSTSVLTGPVPFQVGGMGIRTTGIGSTATDMGIPINQGPSGGTCLLVVNRNTNSGTGTDSGLYMVQFYYDGNHTPALIHIAGDNFITIGKTGTAPNETMTLTNASGGNCSVMLIMNT